MKKEWLTQDKDMQIAQGIIEQFAQSNQLGPVSLFDLVVNKKEKRMDFQVSPWVLVLADVFKDLYGAEQGDLVMRNVIGQCLRGSMTVH